jgi:UDP-glucose 4-epimerase
MARLLVTGAFGFLGAALATRLLSCGYEVVVFGRPGSPTDLNGPGVSPIYGDIRDRPAVEDAVRGVQGVLHMAGLASTHAIVDPATYFAINEGGTSTLLKAISANRKPLPFVFASTAWVYEPAAEPLGEKSSIRPTNSYGASKLAAERVIDDAAAEGVVGAVSLRAFNVAGAYEGRVDRNVNRLIPRTAAVANGRVPRLEAGAGGLPVREYLHVEDFVAAAMLALGACEPGTHRVYNVSSGVGLSVRDVVRIAEQVTDRTIPVTYLNNTDPYATMRSDTRRIQQDLGWSPVSSAPIQIIADAWRAEVRHFPDGGAARVPAYGGPSTVR